jgi:chromodomain-helicase-DNA-binding protein 1
VGATGESTMYWTVKFNGDPNETLETEELEQQFLIKWKGWSHINNTWESEKSIGRRRIFCFVEQIVLMKKT